MDRPPPLSNGYVWIAHTLVRPDRLRELQCSLADGVRSVMKTRDISELGHKHVTEMELWAHPDDLGKLAPLIRRALADDDSTSGNEHVE